MPVKLSELDIRVLEVIEHNGRTYWEEIQRELRFEYPHANWKICFSLIEQKKYVQNVTEPGYAGFIELTDEGKNILESYRHPPQPGLRDVRPIIHNVITSPSKNDSPIKNKSWYETAIFKYIIWPLLVGLIILALTLYFT